MASAEYGRAARFTDDDVRAWSTFGHRARYDLDGAADDDEETGSEGERERRSKYAVGDLVSDAREKVHWRIYAVYASYGSVEPEWYYKTYPYEPASGLTVAHYTGVRHHQTRIDPHWTLFDRTAAVD